MSASPLFAQTYAPRCSDTLDPLLSILADWSASRDSSLDYGYAACATGAGLTVAHDANLGLAVAPGQKLLWPGRLFLSADSTYAPTVPHNWGEAESLLVRYAILEKQSLLCGPEAIVLTRVDTSLGAPWFFVSLCDSGSALSVIWDRADLRSHWWRWIDLPGANSIWPIPKKTPLKLGRQVVRSAMRNLVLAARPDSLGAQYFGLSALSHAQLDVDLPPGSASSLRRIAGLRAATANFISRAVDLWPPAGREPVKLAAFYLQKDAEAWLTLAAVTDAWSSYDSGQRTEWLASLADWETKAAVALDQIVSAPD